MSSVTLQDARIAIHTNAKRVDKRQKKPLPYELQTTPRNRPRLKDHEKAGVCTAQAYGMAVTWRASGLQEAPRGGVRGRYHVRVKRGNGSYCYRKYDEVVTALACKVWLKLNGWESTVVDQGV